MVSFPQVSPPKPCTHLSCLLYVRYAPPISKFLIWSPEYRVKSADHDDCRRVVSPLPYYLVPLRSKYLSQHPIVEHPQPAFLPQCERPSFTPIQRNRQHYSSVCLGVYKHNTLTKHTPVAYTVKSSSTICRTIFDFRQVEVFFFSSSPPRNSVCGPPSILFYK